MKRINITEVISVVSSFVFCFPESSDVTADLTAKNGGPVQVKEEKEEEEEKTEPPAAKRKRGQSKSQIKSKETKEEIKSEGNGDLILNELCT